MEEGQEIQKGKGWKADVFSKKKMLVEIPMRRAKKMQEQDKREDDSGQKKIYLR